MKKNLLGICGLALFILLIWLSTFSGWQQQKDIFFESYGERAVKLSTNYDREISYLQWHIINLKGQLDCTQDALKDISTTHNINSAKFIAEDALQRLQNPDKIIKDGGDRSRRNILWVNGLPNEL